MGIRDREFTDEDNQKVVHNFVAMAKQFYNDERCV